jgi:hypothetical protein
MHFNVYDVFHSQSSHQHVSAGIPAIFRVILLQKYKIVGTQPVNHTVNTSSTRWIKTHHLTASSITPHTLNNINCQDFNNYTFLTYIYNTYIILTENIMCYRVMVIQLTTLVRL